ncbi:PTS system beta-glucoside-specific EIIBCA component [Vibrio ruber DSM 16370]|uniref:PTS system beta-glucoside-specific EIIBCA component n=1 Tax=Vibrio ruber (strain DSM 16370 / JCM 11486 / BCRC 17186 / CECT 7878 / LMG 23124 / VR1) TaxID=1123498 RepID=A0A1R4LCR1_VIBR1|nr:glucose PTS transporter subunit IIA [Vibrio ruber]SJN54183.1 PTS system beta-glucoside-specific EIIBCA component [Vibrio ruber DSM 16370]
MDHYQELASQILIFVGGANNIKSVVHCTTRLRFVLKNEEQVAGEKLLDLPEVVAVMTNFGQYHIVVGGHVAQIYHELMVLLGENVEEKHVHGFFNQSIDIITSIFTPLLGLLAGAGILNGMLMLCSALGWITPDSGIYRLLNLASTSTFIFLPVFLGYTAAKKFKGRPFVGMAIGAAMVHPDIANTAELFFSQEAYSSQGSDTFLGLPIYYIDYSSSVLPVILATWVNAKLEYLLAKFMKFSFSDLLIPALCLAVTVPITFIFIGPLSSLIASKISWLLITLYQVEPGIAGLLMGGIWEILVVFGIHWGLVPAIINNISVYGYDVLVPLLMPAVFGQAGACLGLFFREKDRKRRGLLGSASVTALFGITEPAIYGFTLPRKRPFLFGCLGGALGGGLMGLYQAKVYSMGVMSLFTLTQMIPEHGIDITVYAALAANLIATLFAGYLSYYFSGQPVQKASLRPNADVGKEHKQERKPSLATDTGDWSGDPSWQGKVQQMVAGEAAQSVFSEIISSPLSGEILPLEESADSIFSMGILGAGIVIIPDSGIVYAPADGEVVSDFNHSHAIGIKTQRGVEVFIHIGIDTAKLEGMHFSAALPKGTPVKRGQQLIHFDHTIISDMGYDLETVVIIRDSAQYGEVICHVQKGDPIEHGATLLTVRSES